MNPAARGSASASSPTALAVGPGTHHYPPPRPCTHPNAGAATAPGGPTILQVVEGLKSGVTVATWIHSSVRANTWGDQLVLLPLRNTGLATAESGADASRGPASTRSTRSRGCHRRRRRRLRGTDGRHRPNCRTEDSSRVIRPGPVTRCGSASPSRNHSRP